MASGDSQAFSVGRRTVTLWGLRAVRCVSPWEGRGMQGFERWVWSFVVAGAVLAAPSAPAVTITEVHYHPPTGDEGLEFVEIANDLGSPEDLSGWAFVEGIDFEFPQGTILGPKGILVVCLDPDLVM